MKRKSQFHGSNNNKRKNAISKNLNNQIYRKSVIRVCRIMIPYTFTAYTKKEKNMQIESDLNDI